MAHGTPDWGHARQITGFSLVDDLGELAARLGSIHVHDRRGDVLWMEDFSRGMGAWVSGASGTGASVGLSTTYPKFPPFCARLTGGSTGSGVTYVVYRVGLPTMRRLGVELNVAFFTRFSQLYFWMEHRDGTDVIDGRILLDDTERKVYYRDSDGDYIELDDIGDLQDTQGVYHNLKLVLDFGEEKYARFLFNDEDYDLSAYSLRRYAQAYVPMVSLYCYFYPRSGYNDYCQVDGVILTQDEP